MAAACRLALDMQVSLFLLLALLTLTLGNDINYPETTPLCPNTFRDLLSSLKGLGHSIEDTKAERFLIPADTESNGSTRQCAATVRAV